MLAASSVRVENGLVLGELLFDGGDLVLRGRGGVTRWWESAEA